MKLDHQSLYTEIDRFTVFPEKITEITTDCFKNVFNCDLAKSSKNIVYIWRSEKKIKRLKGESDILYIGQTKQSFRNRYSTYAKLQSTSTANNLKYNQILNDYKSISISVADFSRYGESLR